MRYLSLFSGIGGFELGINKAYANVFSAKGEEQRRLEEHDPRALLDWFRTATKPICIGYSEIDKYATQLYSKHFPNHDNYGDITKIDESTLPDFDLLVGGFPCQSFSIAGKRGGFDDTRGTLFFEIARIVREKQPRLLLLENVKGLLSHDQGRTFAAIISTLDELGYDCQWQVLNSKNFGVPQNRERVFIVGHLRGTRRPEVFPIGESNSKTLEQLIGGSQGNRVYSTNGVSCTQASQAGGQGAKTGLYAVQIDTENGNRSVGMKQVDKANTLTATSYKGWNAANRNVVGISRGRSSEPYKVTEVAPTLRNGDKDNVRAVLTPDRLEKRQNGRRFKENGEPSFTLTAQDKHGIYDGMKIRRLTPVECARLQGFPDDWHEGVSDTQAYKCYGNAVTVNVIEALVEKLL